MAHPISMQVAEGLCRCQTAPEILDDLPDAALLTLFFTERDDSAFATLVRRHGPKVQNVCRRWLGDGQDADDAFQATFIVLVRRAGEAHGVNDLGAWLCGVARRVAARLKTQSQKRDRRETASVDVRNVAKTADPDIDDIPPRLRAEVERLPEKFRRPIELCYWEGLTSEEAAALLGCPTGTLKWRLARARETLRSRLARIGLALAAFLIWRPSAAHAAVVPIHPSSVGLGGLEPSDGSNDLPGELADGTVALARLVRNTLLDFMWDEVPPTTPRLRSRRIWKFWFVAVALFVALSLAALATMPALAQSPPGLARVLGGAHWLRSVTYDALFPAPPTGGACH